ncbi:MAG: hypothetical protein WDW36_006373 [Sanguina aurantia]
MLAPVPPKATQSGHLQNTPQQHHPNPNQHHPNPNQQRPLLPDHPQQHALHQQQKAMSRGQLKWRMLPEQARVPADATAGAAQADSEPTHKQPPPPQRRPNARQTGLDTPPAHHHHHNTRPLVQHLGLQGNGQHGGDGSFAGAGVRQPPAPHKHTQSQPPSQQGLPGHPRAPRSRKLQPHEQRHQFQYPGQQQQQQQQQGYLFPVTEDLFEQGQAMLQDDADADAIYEEQAQDTWVDKWGQTHFVPEGVVMDMPSLQWQQQQQQQPAGRSVSRKQRRAFDAAGQFATDVHGMPAMYFTDQDGNVFSSEVTPQQQQQQQQAYAQDGDGDGGYAELGQEEEEGMQRQQQQQQHFQRQQQQQQHQAGISPPQNGHRTMPVDDSFNGHQQEQDSGELLVVLPNMSRQEAAAINLHNRLILNSMACNRVVAHPGAGQDGRSQPGMSQNGVTHRGGRADAGVPLDPAFHSTRVTGGKADGRAGNLPPQSQHSLDNSSYAPHSSSPQPNRNQFERGTADELTGRERRPALAQVGAAGGTARGGYSDAMRGHDAYPDPPYGGSYGGGYVARASRDSLQDGGQSAGQAVPRRGLDAHQRQLQQQPLSAAKDADGHAQASAYRHQGSHEAPQLQSQERASRCQHGSHTSSMQQTQGHREAYSKRQQQQQQPYSPRNRSPVYEQQQQQQQQQPYSPRNRPPVYEQQQQQQPYSPRNRPPVYEQQQQQQQPSNPSSVYQPREHDMFSVPAAPDHARPDFDFDFEDLTWDPHCQPGSSDLFARTLNPESSSLHHSNLRPQAARHDDAAAQRAPRPPAARDPPQRRCHPTQPRRPLATGQTLAATALRERRARGGRVRRGPFPGPGPRQWPTAAVPAASGPGCRPAGAARRSALPGRSRGCARHRQQSPRHAAAAAAAAPDSSVGVRRGRAEASARHSAGARPRAGDPTSRGRGEAQHRPDSPGRRNGRSMSGERGGPPGVRLEHQRREDPQPPRSGRPQQHQHQQPSQRQQEAPPRPDREQQRQPPRDERGVGEPAVQQGRQADPDREPGKGPRPAPEDSFNEAQRARYVSREEQATVRPALQAPTARGDSSRHRTTHALRTDHVGQGHAPARATATAQPLPKDQTHGGRQARAAVPVTNASAPAVAAAAVPGPHHAPPPVTALGRAPLSVFVKPAAAQPAHHHHHQQQQQQQQQHQKQPATQGRQQPPSPSLATASAAPANQPPAPPAASVTQTKPLHPAPLPLSALLRPPPQPAAPPTTAAAATAAPTHPAAAAAAAAGALHGAGQLSAASPDTEFISIDEDAPSLRPGATASGITRPSMAEVIALGMNRMRSSPAPAPAPAASSMPGPAAAAHTGLAQTQTGAAGVTVGSGAQAHGHPATAVEAPPRSSTRTPIPATQTVQQAPAASHAPLHTPSNTATTAAPAAPAARPVSDADVAPHTRLTSTAQKAASLPAHACVPVATARTASATPAAATPAAATPAAATPAATPAAAAAAATGAPAVQQAAAAAPANVSIASWRQQRRQQRALLQPAPQAEEERPAAEDAAPTADARRVVVKTEPVRH